MTKKFLTISVIIIVLGLVGFFLTRNSGAPVAPIPEGPSPIGATPNPIMVQYRISEMTSEGQFNDALYFTKEQWAKLTKEELAAMVKKRVDNWLNLVKNPPKPKEPTKEELQAQVEQLQQQKDLIQQQLDGINAQIKK